MFKKKIHSQRIGYHIKIVKSKKYIKLKKND